MKYYDMSAGFGGGGFRYEKTTYPDGQISAKITQYSKYPIIEERINSYTDLFYIAAIKEALQGEPADLYIPCMFGQRSDRRFDPSQSFDLRIIANFINNLGFKKVGILDPHSDVTIALINGAVKISPFPHVTTTVNSINTEGKQLVLVSPDAGAYKKVFEYGTKLNVPVVAANKFRDKEGQPELHFLGDVKEKVCLIVDDLCDGGWTFLQLGKQLKEQGAAKVYLYITHAYFSKGYAELLKVLDGVYCTNSVKDIDMLYFDTYKTKDLTGWLKQFKVI